MLRKRIEDLMGKAVDELEAAASAVEGGQPEEIRASLQQARMWIDRAVVHAAALEGMRAAASGSPEEDA